MKYLIHTDGGARGNPGPAAAAAVSYDQNKNIIDQTSRYLSIATNNVAEYKAVALALDWLDQKIVNKGDCELQFFLDSLLVVSQLNRQFKIKNSELVIIANGIFEKLKDYKIVNFTHVPRSQNAKADELVNKCLDENQTV